MRFRKTKLLVLEGDAIFEHLHELAALRIQTAITEVDNWRLGLFADEYARCRGHHLSIVVTGEGGELLRFHERGFLAGIDSRPFHWRQRGIRHRIRVEPCSGNDDALGLSRFGDARYGQRPVFICVGPRRVFVFRLPVALVRAPPSGFFVFVVIVVSIAVVILVATGDREGVLSQAGFDKTTERDRRERGSQSKSNFRMHARDEKELSQRCKPFITFLQCYRSPSATALRVRQRILSLGRWTLSVGR